MNKQEKQLLFFLPVLNLLCGVSIDSYSPTLPDVANYFSTSSSMAQSTITIMIIGFAIGQFAFGFLSDLYGRRKTTILSLIIYIFATVLILCTKSILVLLVLRFIQGVMCGSFAVNSRAIVMDKFKWHSFKLVIVYLSLAWGIGPIISPYLGGVLVTCFNWQAIFIVTLIYAIILLVASIKLIDRKNCGSKQLSDYINISKEIIIDKEFISRTGILGLCFSQAVIFNITAPFWSVNIFKQLPDAFGLAALISGLGYFVGTLINKQLINKVACNKLILFGLTIGSMSSLIFSFVSYESIYTVALTVAAINFGSGFIFANIIAENMSRFCNYGGVFSALQGSITIIIGFAIALAVSFLNQPTIQSIGIVYLLVSAMQIFLFIKIEYSRSMYKIIF
ncbi:multidrug effflux MFS transporter [Francisella sp. Scap27]|uniref:MFS transporter n=1 Tax=Francisella sp. Scap27 TaxID=2589986 RepID=UPI0015BC9B62|nr:MFS transporter [Francisella sp. Scap27]QLE79431.1 multidrug effflux MFS transporter [Francisella sp. Scap27]